MKVTLKPENIFTLQVGETEFKNMRLHSEWEGMQKYVQIGTAASVVLFDTRGNFEKAMDNTRLGSLSEKADYLHVIVASGTILDTIKAANAASQETAGLSEAAKAILAERQRQIEQEGYGTAADDGYADDELSRAAACYALGSTGNRFCVELWPFAQEWWKPSTPQRNLIKAGALILAELERQDRAAAKARQA